jgi:hypothetical protein
MKINWGWAIVIAFILFASFLTVVMIIAGNDRIDLVAPDYYDMEIGYQKRIDDEARAKAIGMVAFLPVQDKLAITFPEGFDAQKASGKIHFYKPDNASIDKVVDMSINAENQHVVNLDELVRGQWIIKINATLNGEGYYWEDSINI